MKANKLLAALLAGVLLSMALITPVTANPPEGGLTPNNPLKQIVRDPLAPTGVDPDALGWVTFVCESLEGFQYSVSVKGLAPNSDYTVVAIAQPFTFIPEIGLLPTSDGGATYALGTIKTNGKGEGEINEGLIPLPAFNAALGIPLGIYEWSVEVVDASGATVLVPGIDPLFGIDYQGFVVFPEWP